MYSVDYCVHYTIAEDPCVCVCVCVCVRVYTWEQQTYQVTCDAKLYSEVAWSKKVL